MNNFSVNITTQENRLFEGEATSFFCPTELGYLEVLAHHAALLASVVPGEITVKRGNMAALRIACAGKGFLEVLNNKVTLILDQARILDK